MEPFQSAYLIVSMMMAGTALIFVTSDSGSRSTRALSLCLLAIALAAFLNVVRGGMPVTVPHAALDRIFRLTAILSGIEWGRRIGQTAQARSRIAANWLFRVAQLLSLIYGLMELGYVILWPERALHAASGILAVRAAEFAVFAPILGSGMLCTLIASVMLNWMRIDRAELVRLRALLLAGPFLLGGLIVAEPLVPVTLTIGLLIFLAGSVRYLMIHSQRGTFMRQFLSPDVARLVQTEGLERVLKRERRPMSVVVCDLRGFTAFARQRDSDAVAEVLERFYEFIGKIASKHGGTVKDHAGDGALILVGAPIAFADHARRAEQLALDLVEGFPESVSPGAPGVGLGIGLATGTLTVGAIRGAGRLEYVAVGTAVNLAARLCMRAEDGEVLADQRTATEGADPGIEFTLRAPETLKGFAEPVAICALARSSLLPNSGLPHQ